MSQTVTDRQRSDSIGRTVFGRPFVKQFAVCYRSIVCLSVRLVYCGQWVEWMKMKLGTLVGLGPGHILLGGDPAPLTQRGRARLQFSAHICCCQIAAWIKMPLGMEVGLGPRHIVLDGDPAPLLQRGTAPIRISAHVC